MFTCQCLNVSITVNDENSINTNVHETLKSDSNASPRRALTVSTSAGIRDGKSRELACFFQEAIGPVHEANVRVQLTTLLKTISTDGWDVNKCLNCGCLVFARDPLKSPTTLLVNASLATTADAVSARMAQESYSAAYRIMLDGRATDFRGFYRKDEYRSLFNAAANTLDSTNDSNELLELLRAFMRTQTQLANEQIARFTQELNEQLCNMRDRAEQDYLFLAQTFVPELEENKKRGPSDASHAAGGTSFQRADSGDRRMEEGDDEKTVVSDGGGGGAGEGGPVAAKALAQLITNVTTAPGGGSVGGPGSQMETPPPTPECMPMSTGNSPPSILHAGGGVVGSSTESSAMSEQKQPQQQQQQQQNSRASSISSSSFASDGQDTTTSSAATTSSSRPVLSNSVANTINNNSTNRGAINKPPTQQQQQQQPHSTSTNLFANHNSLIGAHRFSSSGNNQTLQHGSLDSDCLFDIDGMVNDKTPPPDTYSDEDECDYDDASDNNNQEVGMYIPRYQYGRQNSSIAKSLPISTPKPITPFRGNDDELEEMTEDNIDIAASIKAIAKSVHGDAVFGDLPRPQVQKFTSQI